MNERLRASDLALLAEETPQTPMHNATLEIFDPGEAGLDYDALLAHIDDRISFVPRYRQRIRRVPGRLANPVWVDDENFDLAYHVRRSALPRPGSLDQLRELTARIMSRRLDPDRPLWEIYFVEGLQNGRVALLSKSHQILVDGISTVDLGQVLLDVDHDPRQLVHEGWVPQDEPTPGRLALGALAESVRHPLVAVTTARSNADSVGQDRSAAGRPACGTLAGALSNRRPGPESPFNIEPSAQRRVVCVRTSLKDYRKVRRVHGGTVNDVILATLSGAIRAWLMTRAESVGAGRQAACAGADERHRRGARADVARFPGRRAPRRPADRRGLTRRTPAPGVLRPARPQRDRPRRGGGPDRRRGRLRAHHLPLARFAGRVQGGPRQRQPGDHQRPGTAVPDVPRRRRDGRDLPGAAAVPRLLARPSA